MTKAAFRQAYPREEKGILAKSVLFPKLNPPLPIPVLQAAIEQAFERAKKNKAGEELAVPNNPEELVHMCLKHIKERADPVLGTSFYTKLDLSEILAPLSVDLPMYSLVHSLINLLVHSLVNVFKDEE